MKIIHKDIQKGVLKAKVENLDDLWYLSHIIDTGDSVKGTTFRKIRIGNDENAKVVKKKVFLKIIVEKIEFHKYADILRVSGKITEGPEDVSTGSYHTFNIEAGTEFTLNKKEFLDYQLEKLDEAVKSRNTGVLLVVFDREHATIALLKNYCYDILSEINGNVQKKDSPELIKKNTFYSEIIKMIKEYVSRYNITKVVVGSSAFWKEYLLDEMDAELKKITITASCNNTGKSGINEVIKRPEVVSALSDARLIKEAEVVEKVLSEIKKNGKCAYGMENVVQAVNAGAVSDLIVADSVIMRLRQEENYEKLDSIMKTASSMQAKIHIISSDHDAGKSLEGIGGIAALTRYKLSYQDV